MTDSGTFAEMMDARRSRIQGAYEAQERDPLNLWIREWNIREIKRAVAESNR